MFEVAAAAGDVHAVVVLVPGGREGIARAGALPNARRAAKPIGRDRAAREGRRSCVPRRHDEARLRRRADPRRAGHDPRGTSLSASRLATCATFPSTRTTRPSCIYVSRGHGTLTVGGIDVAITSTSVVQIPPACATVRRRDFSGSRSTRRPGPSRGSRNDEPGPNAIDAILAGDVRAGARLDARHRRSPARCARRAQGAVPAHRQRVRRRHHRQPRRRQVDGRRRADHALPCGGRARRRDRGRSDVAVHRRRDPRRSHPHEPSRARSDGVFIRSARDARPPRRAVALDVRHRARARRDGLHARA